jgi:hypothetical protein
MMVDMPSLVHVESTHMNWPRSHLIEIMNCWNRDLSWTKWRDWSRNHELRKNARWNLEPWRPTRGMRMFLAQALECLVRTYILPSTGFSYS